MFTRPMYLFNVFLFLSLVCIFQFQLHSLLSSHFIRFQYGLVLNIMHKADVQPAKHTETEIYMISFM